MIELSLLAVFLSTFFFVSITPGMCMTLAMTMGMTIGVRRTLWMMWGELAGVGLVAVSAVIGVATIMLNYPALFTVFKYAGGAYLCFLGVQLWRSRGKMAVSNDSSLHHKVPATTLMLQGFVTAVANPKGWAFFIALLPPFIDPAKALVPQLSVLVAIILCIEFICLLAYASGGKSLRAFLQQRGNVQIMNRIAGTLMFGVGIWLAAG